MATKGKKVKNVVPTREEYDKNIMSADINEVCMEYGKIFAVNTNILRQIPWVASGLKVVETRLLYTMYKRKLFPDARFQKVADVQTSVLEIHPHGDSGIYDVITGNSQEWNNNCTTVEIQGNRGSKSGQGPSAARYIECRMSVYAYKCFFEDFDAQVVDFKPNYTESTQEPEFVLPSRYPHILVNNVFSIGQGVSASMYPCNFNEVCELTIKLMTDQEADCTLYPDIPSGSTVIDDGQFPALCETGGGDEYGRIRTRGEAVIDEKRNEIHFYSAPIFYDMYKFGKKLVELKETKVIDWIDYEDQTEEYDDCHWVLKLKSGVDPYKTLQIIYAKTGMQATKHINMIMIDNYGLNKFNIREILLTWLSYRRDYLRRVNNHKLVKKYERKHILETLLFILSETNIEKTMKIARKAKNRAEIADQLMKTFKISSIQASAISYMRIYELSREYAEKYKEENKKLTVDIKELESLVKSKERIDELIVEQLKEGMELFGQPRKSKIVNIDNEQLIKKSKHTLIFTEMGFVKKLKEDTTSIGQLKEGDNPIEIIHIDNAATLMIFDDRGMITTLPVSNIPASDSKSNGHLLKNIAPSVKGKIVALKVKPTDKLMSKLKDKLMILFITKNGISKKTKLSQYCSGKVDLVGITIKPDDELRAVKIFDKDSDLLIYTSRGYGCKVKTKDIKETSRLAIGSRLIKLEENEEVINCDLINKDDRGIFSLTSKGNGKVSDLKTLPYSNNGESLIIIKLSPDEDVRFIRTVKGNEKFGVFLKNSVERVNIEDLLPPLPRLSKGKKIIPVRRGECVIAIKQVPEGE